LKAKTKKLSDIYKGPYIIVNVNTNNTVLLKKHLVPKSTCTIHNKAIPSTNLRGNHRTKGQGKSRRRKKDPAHKSSPLPQPTKIICRNHMTADQMEDQVQEAEQQNEFHQTVHMLKMYMDKGLKKWARKSLNATN
jgi:hypothetical protein